jgi:hypothetical protein
VPKAIESARTTHRALISVTLAVVACFWLLAFLDRQLFVVHFYESLIYLAISALLLRFNDRWACMLGMLAPAAWLTLILVPAAWTLLGVLVGSPPVFLGTASFLGRLQRPSSAAIVIEAATLILSASMLLLCLSAWKIRPVARLRNTFLTCLITVAVYYGVLIIWLLKWNPVSA